MLLLRVGRLNVYHVGSVSETCCKSYCCEAHYIDAGRRRCSVDFIIVAPGSSSVLRVLGNNYSMSKVEGAIEPKQSDLRIYVYMICEVYELL